MLLADVQVWLSDPKGISSRVDGTLTTQSDLHENLHRLFHGDNVTAFGETQCTKPASPGIPSLPYTCFGMRLETNRRAVWIVEVVGRNLTAVKAFWTLSTPQTEPAARACQPSEGFPSPAGLVGMVAGVALRAWLSW